MMIRKKNLSALVGPEICNKELNEVYGMYTPYQSIHNPVDSEAPIYDLQKKEIVFLLNENNISFPFSSDHAVVRLVALVCTEYSTDIPLAINFHHPVGGDMLTIPSLVECSGIENGKCVDILLNTMSGLGSLIFSNNNFLNCFIVSRSHFNPFLSVAFGMGTKAACNLVSSLK